VRRAINLAEKTVQEKKKIYTMGPLIHNPQEVKRLADQGIKPIENPLRLKKTVLLLRTHGIPAGIRENLEKKDLSLVDATCPFVKRAQDMVKQLCNDNCHHIIIVGEKTHPEVVALVSYGKGKCCVVEKKADLRHYSFSGKIGVVSQTTQTPKNFNDIIRVVKQQHLDVKIHNTICKATMDRQTAAGRLAKKVDIMIVVGGKNSGNTRRLTEICRASTCTHHIETENELRSTWFKGVSRIGITAGASTPDWIIEEVKKKIAHITTAGTASRLKMSYSGRKRGEVNGRG
jgi:4-hydroxy-3-methylbut-2-enyl diphosphate reductase